MSDEAGPNRMNDKLWCIELASLPAGFRDMVQGYGLASDGQWKTFSPDSATAQKEVAEFIKVISGEAVDPASLVVSGTAKRRKTAVKWTGDPAKIILKKKKAGEIVAGAFPELRKILVDNGVCAP